MKYKLMLRPLQVLPIIAAAMISTVCAHAAPVSTALPASDTIKARGGVIRITPKFHASLQIEYAGKVIVVDPVSAASWTKKADLILITHAHGDHFDKAAINKLSTASTHIVAPPSITKELQSVVKVGSRHSLLNGPALNLRIKGSQLRARRASSVMLIQVVPMYNVVRGPKPGQKFHPKGVLGTGYIITLGGKRIYIAGDTEATPEMRKLKNIHAAFLPMNLPFTMTPQEAAGGARAFKPKIVYPYHHRYPFNKPNSNTQQFAAAMKGSGIQVRLLNWYPAAAVAHAMAQ